MSVGSIDRSDSINLDFIHLGSLVAEETVARKEPDCAGEDMTRLREEFASFMWSRFGEPYFTLASRGKGPTMRPCFVGSVPNRTFIRTVRDECNRSGMRCRTRRRQFSCFIRHLVALMTHMCFDISEIYLGVNPKGVEGGDALLDSFRLNSVSIKSLKGRLTIRINDDCFRDVRMSVKIVEELEAGLKDREHLCLEDSGFSA